MSFGGPGVSQEDAARFCTQLEAVRSIMLDGYRHTKAEIRVRLARDFGIYADDASVSARIRDLRKPEFGGYCVTRNRERGRTKVWHYQIRNSGGCHT